MNVILNLNFTVIMLVMGLNFSRRRTNTLSCRSILYFIYGNLEMHSDVYSIYTVVLHILSITKLTHSYKNQFYFV